MPSFHHVQQKKKKIIWIVIGILFLVGIGTITYFAWPKKEVKTETKNGTPSEVVQQLQTYLTEQKSRLGELKEATRSQENLLADKSYTDTLTSAELAQLEQDLGTSKQKILQLEGRINKLETQLTNFSTQTIPDQEELVRQLEQESKDISQGLGMDYKLPEPVPSPQDGPQPQKVPPQDNPPSD